MFNFEAGEFRKYGSRSCPYSYAISFPDVLTKLYLRIHGTFITVTPFVITTHGIRTSQCCHQSPRWITVIQQRMELSSQYSPFPHRMIIAGSQFCAAESIFITEECGTESLIYSQVIATIGICEEIP